MSGTDDLTARPPAGTDGFPAPLGPVLPSMESPDGKLRRGKQHLQTLDNQIALARCLDNHTITVKDNPQTCEYVFTISNIRKPDPNWSYLVGDCVHNLRSALDHLVYQLAVGTLGRDLTTDEARSTGFPIESNPAKFPKPREGRLKFVRAGEYTRIAELQPFNAWEPSIWGVSPAVGNQSPAFAPVREGRYRWNPGEVPLFLDRLAALDNFDKHRLVHAVYRAPAWMDDPDPPIAYRGVSYTAEALVDGTEICRWKYEPPRPELPADMDMTRYFPLEVEFGSPPFFMPAVAQLGFLAEAVEIVLEVFRPCIADGGPPLSLTGR